MSDLSSKKANRATARINAMTDAYASILDAERKANFGTEEKERSIIIRAQDAVDKAITELYAAAPKCAIRSELNEYLSDGWENCLEEIECFIFGKSRLATRYNDRELIAALSYLGRSLVWKRKNPGREEEWIGSPEWEHAMNISQGFLDNQK